MRIETVMAMAVGADDGRCGDENVLASTTPGSRRVSICRRFERAYRQDRIWTEVVVIHESLHTLGLGENPPTSGDLHPRRLPLSLAFLFSSTQRPPLCASARSCAASAFKHQCRDVLSSSIPDNARGTPP